MRMRRKAWWIAGASLVAVVMLAAACGGDDDELTETQAALAEAEAALQAAQQQASAAQDQLAEAQAQATEAGGDLPFTHVLEDGSTFELNERIAKKIRTGAPINYLFSYQSSGIALFSDQYEAGFRSTQGDAFRIYPMNFTVVAPVTSPSDIQQQIAQIDAQVSVDQVDCLAIEPADSDSFTELTNRLLADGIPVFTVGLTTNGNEFTNFTQVPYNEGARPPSSPWRSCRRTGSSGTPHGLRRWTDAVLGPGPDDGLLRPHPGTPSRRRVPHHTG